jgi:hypothetical protein
MCGDLMSDQCDKKSHSMVTSWWVRARNREEKKKKTG